MAKITAFNETNESARFEWLDATRRIVRFHYSSRFYGSCTAIVELSDRSGQLGMRREAFSIEDAEVKRGTVAALRRSAQNFLRFVLLRHSDRLGLRPTPKERVGQNGSASNLSEIGALNSLISSGRKWLY
jgi:hypothetical protein